MIKHFEVITNTRGDSLPNYRVQVVDSAGATVTIYEDSSGTRFTDSSGNIINYATADSRTAKVEFYWTPATGQVLQVLDLNGELVDATADFADKYVLSNLPGNIAQSAVTNLTTDLAAKAATADLASTDPAKGASLVRTTDDFNVQQEIDFINGPVFYAEKYGVVADGSTDNATALGLALTAVQASGGTLMLPPGTIQTGAISNWAAANVTIAGSGMKETVLKFTNAGTAFNADAFASGSPSDPFLDQFNVRDLTIEGNSGTTEIVMMQGISRSHWQRVNVREAGGTAAKGFNLRGVVTVLFESCYCSKNYNTMTNYPTWGLYAQAGSRAGSSVGQTSNCTFINCEFNGLQIGFELFEADQTQVIGGAAQNCTGHGMIVRPTCRYNTFIGVAYENAAATNFDVQEQGILSTYIGCYSVKEFRLQGDRVSIKSCYFERLQIDSGAEHPTVESIVVNNWATGSGGFSNASTTLRWRTIYDIDAAAYVYPSMARTGITVGASPFTWTNTIGIPVKVAIQTGTVSQVRGKRGADAWLLSPSIPEEHVVAPGDGIEVTYSASPGMSYVPLGGF